MIRMEREDDAGKRELELAWKPQGMGVLHALPSSR
jgi:hypothetical protein